MLKVLLDGCLVKICISLKVPCEVLGPFPKRNMFATTSDCNRILRYISVVIHVNPALTALSLLYIDSTPRGESLS